MTPTPFISFVVILVGLLVAGSACAQNRPIPLVKPAESDTRFPVLDSGFPSGADMQDDPYWLDDNRVIFRGIDIATARETNALGLPIHARGSRSIDDHGFTYGYYIWDTRKNSVSLYKRGIWKVCIEDGVVYYLKLPTTAAERSTVWAGKPGQEKQLPMEPGDYLGPRLDDPKCLTRRRIELRNFNELRGPFGSVAIPLWKAGESPLPALYYAANGKSVVNLGLSGQDLANARYLWAPWRRQYLIQESPSKPGVQTRAWWFDANGTITPIPLPDLGLWPNAKYFPARPGLLIWGARSDPGATKYDGMDPHDRLMLLTKDALLVVVDPLVRRVAISADGCRVAYVRMAPLRASMAEWEAGRRGEQTLRMVDLCNNGSK